MVIENGFWNYYLVFRLESYDKATANIISGKTMKGVAAFAWNNRLLESPDFLKIEEQLVEAVDAQKGNILEVNKAFGRLFGQEHNVENFVLALMPLKMYFSETEFIYCPVYITLLKNGWGIIKLAVELKHIDVVEVSHFPMKRWFGKIQIWTPTDNGRYETVVHEGATITDLIQVLQQTVYKIFDKNLKDRNRFTGFETFVISETSNPDMIQQSKMNEAGLKDIFRFANPEDFAAHMSKDQLYQWWNESHCEIGGVNVIKGGRCRMILYADVEEFIKLRPQRNVQDRNEYLELSMERTFDPFLFLALCQKDNEIYVYEASKGDLHRVYSNMATYSRNENYFEDFLARSPKNGRKFYEAVREILKDSFVDVEIKLERLKYIESYEKELLNEKRTLMAELLSIIFGVLFGLPPIHDTIELIRNMFATGKDMVPYLTVDGAAFLVWIALLVVLCSYYGISYKKYRQHRR